MASRKTKPKSKTLRRKLSKKLKAYHARVRRIQESEPELTYMEARHVERRSFMHTIEKVARKVAPRFLEIAIDPKTKQGIWKKVKPGKPVKYQNTFGKRMKFSEVMRSFSLSTYHGLVSHLMQLFGKPRAEIVRMMQDFRAGMVEAARSVGKSTRFRSRDIAAVIEFSERYPKLRIKYGI